MAAVDATKLNELMENLSVLAVNLNKRLAGGLHGEYFEAGSRLDDKHRPAQLEILFSFRKELADFKALMEKQIDPEQARQGKGGAVPANKSMVATIKTVVTQEMTEKLRDLSLCNERLEAKIEKSQTYNEGLESKVKTQESKLKKAEERTQNLQEKVKKLEAENATFRTRLAATERNVTTTLATQSQILAQIDPHVFRQMQGSVNNLQGQVSTNTQRVGDLSELIDLIVTLVTGRGR